MIDMLDIRSTRRESKNKKNKFNATTIKPNKLLAQMTDLQFSVENKFEHWPTDVSVCVLELILNLCEGRTITDYKRFEEICFVFFVKVKSGLSRNRKFYLFVVIVVVVIVTRSHLAAVAMGRLWRVCVCVSHVACDKTRRCHFAFSSNSHKFNLIVHTLTCWLFVCICLTTVSRCCRVAPFSFFFYCSYAFG